MRLLIGSLVCFAVAGCRLPAPPVEAGERLAALERWALRQEGAARAGGPGSRPVTAVYAAHAGLPDAARTVSAIDEKPRVRPDGREVYLNLTLNWGEWRDLEVVRADRVESSADGRLRLTVYNVVWNPNTREYTTSLAVGGDGEELVP